MPWLMMVLLLFIGGCKFNQHPIENQFETYLERVANVQQQSALPAVIAEPFPLPAKRDLILPIESVTIGLLDSYELRKCRLFNLIAEKNSSLGKVQDQFREFDFQHALIQGLEQCLGEANSSNQRNDNTPLLSPQLTDQLSDILHIKRKQQPLYTANLLFTSDTMRTQLNATRWVDAQSSQIDPQVLAGLNVINSAYLQSQSAVITDSEDNRQSVALITPYQEALEKSPAVGGLLYSMYNATRWLETMTQQLTQHDAEILCQPNRDRTNFNYLNNVFRQFFINEIQAYLALLDAQYYQLAPFLPMFRQAHPNFQYPLETAHAAFRLATLEHVQYWQGLFKRCGKPLTR